MSATEETVEEDEVSFAPTPSPDEARARLAALRGKPLEGPSRLVTEAPAEPMQETATPAPAAPLDLAATVAALVAESLKQLGRPAEVHREVHREVPRVAKTEKPLFKPMKVRITTRVDADVLDAFKATGPNWQTRLNDVLRENMPTPQR